MVLLQQPSIHRLRETHINEIKKLIAYCSQEDIDMKIIYDQEEKGDRQERRERLASLFREALTLFDETKEQFGIFKLLSVGQPDEDSDEVPLNRIIKRDNQIDKKDAKEEEKDLTKVQIRKPYDVIEIVKNGSKHVEDNKEVECISLCPSVMDKQEYLAVGFIDGVIEVWNKNTLQVATSGAFEFQKGGKFMGHSCHILFLEFSDNGKVLASGDSEGTIKIWNFSKGK